MPFKSKSQQRKFFADPKLRGKAKKWAAETPDMKNLPEKKSSYEMLCELGRLTKSAKIAPTPPISGPFAGLGEYVAKNFPSLFQGYTRGQTIRSALKNQAKDMPAGKAKGIIGKGGRVKQIAEAAELSRRHNNIGMGTAGVGAGGVAAAGTAAMTMGGAPEQKTAAALGTPFTDGVLQYCLDARLDTEQVAVMLEKGAALGGCIGQECQGILDRMIQHASKK